MRRVPVGVTFALAALLSAAPAAHTTTVVPVHDDDLIAGASAIVTGQVTTIESYLDGPRIYTTVTLAVQAVLKGEAVPEITLKQVGGRVGGEETWLDGSPEFRRGERVLVFLRPNPDGTPRVAHLYQGKFSVVADALTGEEFIHQETPDTVSVLGGVGRRGGFPGPVIRGLRNLKDLIGRRVRDEAARGGLGRAARLRSAAAPATAAVQPHERFTYLGSPSRWFDPDAGQPVRMLLNGAGEPRAPGRGFEQVRSALRAWSAVGGSSFRYEDGGTTSAAGFRRDGVSAISFADPLGEMDPPSRCTGTLAIGGYHRSGETRVVGGQPFFRIVEGDIVFNRGWEGCGFYEDFASLAEVATHELGHVLGLGHSADREATMYAYAHFDGRGAMLRADDLVGVRSLYPGLATAPAPPAAGTLAVTFPDLTEGQGVSGGSVAVTIRASGASGSPNRFWISVDGTLKDYWVVTGTTIRWWWPLTGLAAGEHTLSVKVQDASGRTGTGSVRVRTP